MAKTLYARGSDGTVVIHDGTSAAVDNPLGNLRHLFFHSSLDYLAVVSEHTGTLACGAGSGSTSRSLFAHGRTGTPLVAGVLVPSGQPLVGTTITWMAPSPCDFRGLTLGSTDTHVVIHEIAVKAPAQTFNYRIFVFDRNFQ
ncbi:hypothetical protein N825_25455 [Skermanella stibiiresistens SB22]|uniref:Uncharacterized protein n=1 Tax=Skermanella stibiiresistens SB22 TaxID=1385369 RepID=W9GSQ3_9PROT|nr:hypothetical protein [Skermanella stibiiresistens]EWY36784.1 hypothetical protein N825_25455 [Skermanella stibiiresistens SB22]